MKITKIALQNIRCFKDLEINLTNKDGAKKWLVILGDNGVGKTTLLRSIVLGLCEESSAAGLYA
jgi:predicted ATP-binding protein involved in virulence